jgi:DNA-binding NtrC family response regulator
MQVFDAQLTKAARSDLPLLIAGETGVGKERAAGLAHARSRRQGDPFVAINCGAVPRELAESMLFGHEKGAFTGALTRMQGVCEEVGAGTLLLDEIAELPLDLQPKLLRLLEQKSFRPVGSSGEKAFRGRVIAATHRDLKERVAEGAFREDLYFRLAVIDLRIPALRERREEIVALAHVLLNDAQARGIGGHVGRPFAFTDAALLAMRSYEWPGNVRELRNRIERAMALADTADLRPADLFPDRNLPASADQALAPLDKAAEEAIRARVLEALRQCGGNQSNAAKLLGVSRTTIWKYGRK